MSQTNLTTLLETLSPTLNPMEMVFCCLELVDVKGIFELQPFAIIRESEGWTVIIGRDIADKMGWEYQGVFGCITLEVHSSLEAVGLTAVVSSALAERGISANVVAGFHHDHIFMLLDRAKEALNILLKLPTS